MQAVALVGYKNSGKTGLAVKLCQELRSRGYKVAAIKYSHHQLDRQNTDSCRLAQACFVAAGLTDTETSLVWSEPKALPDLLPILQADVLIVEGGKDLQLLPRILLCTDREQAVQLRLELALGLWREDLDLGLPLINDVSHLADVILKHGFFLPGLDCGHCGFENCSQLAVEIVAGRAGIQDCKTSGPELQILVNGQPLALNPFVQNIVKSTLQGMLSSLKGYVPGRIEISWEQ